MKNKFKIALMAIMTIFITTGCSEKTISPSEVVKNYFKTIQET